MFTVTDYEVEVEPPILANSNTNKASGPDELPNKIMKTCAKELNDIM